MANKIKYGLKNVFYAVATIASDGSATYGTPAPLHGAVSLSVDAQGDTTKFYADNVAYSTFVANSGYSGSLELALIPEDFETDVLGFVKDGNIIVEDAGASTKNFALMFQFEGDEAATKHVLYNCTATRPTVAGQTTEQSIEVKTDTLNIECASIYNIKLGKDIVKAKLSDSSDPAYATWTTAVYQPTT